MAHRHSWGWWIVAALGGAAAAAAVVVASAGDDAARTVRGLLLVALLALVCWIDLDRRLIPNRLTGAGALAAIALTLATTPGDLPSALAWAAGAGGFLLLPALIRPDGMGMGDVKLAAVLGLFLGPAVVAALLLGLLAATLAGGVVLARDLVAARRAAATVPAATAPAATSAAATSAAATSAASAPAAADTLRAARTATLPLGPFLAIGALAAFLLA